MLPPPCLTVRQVMSGAWFPPDMMLRIEVKHFNLGFSRESCFSQSAKKHVKNSQTPSGSFTEEGLPLIHSAIKPRSMEYCSDGCRSGRFSGLHTGSLELSQSDHCQVRDCIFFVWPLDGLLVDFFLFSLFSALEYVVDVFHLCELMSVFKYPWLCGSVLSLC